MSRSAVLLLLAVPLWSSAANLEIRVTPGMSGEELQPASLRYRTVAGESYSVTRVSYLLSDFALQRDDGTWLEFTNSVAWMDAGQNRDSIRLTNAPAGNYRSLRFLVGLNTNLNHADTAKFGPSHPLNPALNNLSWSWQGGYIFLALEGLWRNAAGQFDGWAYHFARDPNCTAATVAIPLVLSNESRIDLDFDLAALLNAPHPLSFARDGTSTHSRAGDPVAAALGKNLPGAFRLRRVSEPSATEIAASHPQPLFLPEKFTPYPFKMSALFPMPDLPQDNPLTVERVELGRELFNDREFSINDTQSCADCHIKGRAFTDGRAGPLGAEGRAGPRKTMPLSNLAWKRVFFWDGRARSLREQVLVPIQNPIEMHQDLPGLVRKLSRDPSIHGPKFAAAFGSPEITVGKIALALENYLLTLTSFDSKFDRALRGEVKLDPAEQRGFELFSTEYDPRRGQFGADCFHCHGGALFRSQEFANNGLDSTFADTGYQSMTGRPADLGKFAVPSLRNVALSGPYMHDGRFRTLEEVVEHYATGVKRSATLDPNLAKHPDGGVPLSADDKKALVSFLKTLTDDALAGNAAPPAAVE